MADVSTTTATTTDNGAATTEASASATLFPDQGKPPVDTKTDEVKTDAKPDADSQAKAEPTKTDEQTKTDAKVNVPESYDLKAPEGMTLDEAAVVAITPVFKELNITNEAAQKLVEAQATIQQEQLVRQADAWLTAAKADKEVGGQAFDANSKIAQEAFAKFGTPELKTFLDQTGLGNHPELLRAFVRIGKAGQSDTHVPADGSGGKTTDPAKTLFPNMN